MSTFSKEFNSDKHIIIPSIQREYIQPLNQSVINGFADALVKAYANDEKKDLNYIYGLESETSFVPIDGQQRLTTLWLLHLYVAARKGQILTAGIEYKTRDVSSDFCVKLRENAVSILATSQTPSKDIVNANWFIETWIENITVSSMLHALDVIRESIETSDTDIDILWKNMTKDDSPISFAFMSTKDLGDDVYVKMNARGKSLSDFENLKSWLDDRLKELVEDGGYNLNQDFLTSWREYIDNEWTDLFWRNRNLNDLFPEEIDDEQIRLFYNIAFIIWANKNRQERKSIIRDTSSIKSIASLLKVDPNNVIDELLERMRSSSVDLPLYILDKLNIFNEEFFLTVKEVLNGLISYEEEINTSIQALNEEEYSEKIYFWNLPKVKTPITFMCQLLMSEKEETVPYSKLVLGGALCYYVRNASNKTNLRDWLRFSRNIVNNTAIGAENVHNVLSAFNYWALLCANNDICEVITKIDAKTPGVDSKQIKEEKDKILLYNRTNVIHAVRRLENHRFFFGRIVSLLELLKDVEPKDFDTTLINYAGILYRFFGNDGPNFDSKEDKYLTHRILLACSEYYGIGYEYKKSWCLFESKEEWKSIYLEDDGFSEDNGMPHNIGIWRMLKEIGIAENLTKPQLENILNEYKEKVSDWRRPLLEYPELWDYMGNNCLKFYNNYNVLLIPGVILQSTGRRAELRARSLYIELKCGECLKEICPPKEGEEFHPFGWQLRFWQYGSNRKDKNSCIFFEKKENEEMLVIDIYFDTENASKNKTEHSYCIELFVRENKRMDSEMVSINESFWCSTVNSIHEATAIRQSHQGRYLYSNLSKQDVINMLKSNILPNK